MGSRQGYYADYRWTSGQHTSVVRRDLYPCSSPWPVSPRRRRLPRSRAGHCSRAEDLRHTTGTGQQWDAPNGWAPLQWIAVRGLRALGRDRPGGDHRLPMAGQRHDCVSNSRKLVEKYNVVNPGGGSGGEYPLQDGFGWTNGVTLRLLALYPAYANSTADQCPECS